MASREILVRLRAEVGNFRSSMAQAASASRSTGEAATAMGTATSAAARAMIGPMTQAQAAAQNTRQALFDAGKAAQESAAGFGLSYNAAGRLTDQFGNVVTEAHAAELGLDTASEATQEYAAQTVAAAAEASAAAAAATAASQSGIDSLLANAAANEEVWDKVGKGMLVVGGAIAAGVGVAIAKFASFDKAMSSVDAATHETAANMELLREKAIQVGADTAFSAEEAAQGIEELAKAGVSTADILGGGLAGSMDLAAAGALGVGDAAEIAATALVQFGLEGKDIPHIADLLAAGAGKAQGSVEDIAGALKQSGLVAAQFGLSIEDTVGSLAAFASAGLVGSDAGTSFKSMLLKLAAPAKATQTLMDDLGISAYDAGGEFVGITGLADQLKNNLGDLTQAQRDSALATIFGTDAIRGANVLYEKGADGIQAWIDNVNDAGYAAETAARMQDNLAGDIEKLGGAFDTLMIKSGSGPAEMLRGIVQAAEGAVDALGKVPGPVLTTITAVAALVGGVALLGGAFITAVPKIAATRAALVAFNTASPGVVSGMKKLGGATAALAVAFVALAAAKTVIDKSQSGLIATSEKTTQALIGMGNSTQKVDELFRSFDGAGHFVADGIQGIGDALHRVENLDFNETMNQFTGIGDLLKPAREQLVQIDESLSDLVTSGNAEAAANAFKQIAKAGTDSGVAAEVTAGHFTKYQDALRKQASTLNVALTDEEVYQWALGNTPPLIDAAKASAEGQTAAAEAMAAANEETAQRLADVGLAADGTVASLGKLLEAMFATGLAQLSANEASIKWQESLEGLDASINKYGTSLDITTEAGKANSRALDGMAQAGISNMEAMANNGATQEQLQGTMRGTYDSLVAAAGRFGKTAEEADAYARKVLGIPDDANVDTAIKNYADSMAKLNGIDTTVRNLDGKTANVWVTTHQKSIYSEEHVSTGQGGSGGQTRWMGGLVGFASGGVVPGRAPLNPRIDNVLAMTQNGTPYKIRSGEMIVNEQATKANLPLLTAINDGTYQAPSKSLAGGYGAGMSRAAYQVGSGGGFDSAALDRLTDAVRSARQINVNQLATSRATSMATAREMEGL